MLTLEPTSDTSARLPNLYLPARKDVPDFCQCVLALLEVTRPDKDSKVPLFKKNGRHLEVIRIPMAWSLHPDQAPQRLMWEIK